MSDYKFFLAQSSDMANLYDLTTVARGKSVQFGLNISGTCQFSIPLDWTFSDQLIPVSTCIKVYKNDVLRWSGPVWTLDASLSDNTLQVNAVGWFELLRKRYTEVKITSSSGTSWGARALALLANANSDKATWITAGTNTHAVNFTADYVTEQYSEIGAEIDKLMQVENGYDYWVDPSTRALNIYSARGTTKPDAVFGYDFGPKNVVAMNQTIDADVMANRVIAQGTYNAGKANDVTAQNNYQLFTRFDNVNIADDLALASYVNIEVALNKNPRMLYSFQPFPESEPNVPVFMEDYDIGDTVYLSARKAPRISLQGQPIRVFGLTVEVDENGNEKLSAIQGTAQ